MRVFFARPRRFVIAAAIALVGIHGVKRWMDAASVAQLKASRTPAAARFEFDPDLKPETRRKLDELFAQMRTLRFSPNSRTPEALKLAYSRLFYADPSDEGGGDLLPFLSERIRSFHPALLTRAEEDSIVASNLSVIHWIERIARADSLEDFETRLPKDPRSIGRMELGPLFDRTTALEGVGVLLHEARHSDCPFGIQLKDAKKWRGRTVQQVLSSPETGDPLLRCGYPHQDCPRGHALYGTGVCEPGLGWGPNAVQLAYFHRIAQSCVNCSEPEIQAAIAAMGEAASRILDLDRLLDGRDGPPLLLNQGLRKDD